jgi:hypothetical protein
MCWLFVIAPYVLAVMPGMWLVAAVLKIAPLTKEQREQMELHTPLAGWIGVLERWLVIYLIGRGEWSALGFVVAAKGLLRIPELRSPFSGGEGDPGLSHILSSYILLGTLLSLALAALLAEASRWAGCCLGYC